SRMGALDAYAFGSPPTKMISAPDSTCEMRPGTSAMLFPSVPSNLNPILPHHRSATVEGGGETPPLRGLRGPERAVAGEPVQHARVPRSKLVPDVFPRAAQKHGVQHRLRHLTAQFAPAAFGGELLETVRHIVPSVGAEDDAVRGRRCIERDLSSGPLHAGPHLFRGVAWGDEDRRVDLHRLARPSGRPKAPLQ